MVSSKIILRLLPLWVATCCCTVLGEGIPIAHAQETADDGFVTSPSVSARRPLRLGSASMSEVPKMRASAKNKRLNADLSDSVTEYEDLNVDMKSLGSSQHPDRDAKFIPLQAREQVTDPKQVVSETKFTNLIIGEHLATEFRDPTNYNYAGASRNLSVMTDEMGQHRRAKEGKALKAKAGKANKSKKSKSGKSTEIENSDARTWSELMEEYEELNSVGIESSMSSREEILGDGLKEQQTRLNTLKQKTRDVARRRLEVNNAASDPGCDQDKQCNRIVSAIQQVQNIVSAFLSVYECIFNKKETEEERKECTKNWFAQGVVLLRVGVTILSFFFGGWTIFAAVVVELLSIVVEIWKLLKDSKEPVVTLTNKEMLDDIFERTRANEEDIDRATQPVKDALYADELADMYDYMDTFNTIFDSNDEELINESTELFFDELRKGGLGVHLNSAKKDIDIGFRKFTRRDTDYLRNKLFLSKQMFNESCYEGPCGKGAVEQLVVDRNYTRVRECLNENQEVINTLPLFFQGIVTLKEYVTTFSNLLVKSRMVVENIRKVEAFKNDKRLKDLDEMVSCHSEHIDAIVSKLDDRKEKHKHCMTLDELLDDEHKKNKKPFDFNLPVDFKLNQYYEIGMWRLALNTLREDNVAGALKQTCTKNGKCNFPYLLGRCNEERLPSDANGAVTISGGSRDIQGLRSDTCKVEDNTISWVKTSSLGKPWQDCLITFKAGTGNAPPEIEEGCNCNTVIDKCKRCGIFCDGSKWLDKNAYVYALPEYCMINDITIAVDNGWQVPSKSPEEKCYDEMDDDDKWMIPRRSCPTNLIW